MANRKWMITNRQVLKDGLSSDRGRLAFFVSSSGQIDRFSSWTELPEQDFIDELTDAADEFPLIEDPSLNEKQKHVTLFIHGFNNSWQGAARLYAQVCDQLFATPARGLGQCVLFTWPSDGMITNYLPDRSDARSTAPDLADLLSMLYDHLVIKQRLGARDASLACKAKTSIISHSMGNYVLQKAMQLAWTRHNQPLLVSLINQLVMIAADVDNDLFGMGEAVTASDGDAIANLTYRITALYSGRDSVLGMSAGLKHFGKRRLGRSGLDRNTLCPDNVWDIDCSKLLAKNEKDIHSGYFHTDTVMKVVEQILRGTDRTVLMDSGILG